MFTRPEAFAGREYALASDARTLEECRDLYADALGRPPRTFPMPEWLFDRFTRHDVTTMWRWLRIGDVPLDTEATRELLPSALTVSEWLTRQRLSTSAPA